MDIKPPFDAERYRQDLEVSQGNLSLAFSQQGALFAYYAQSEVNMMRQEGLAEQHLEIIEAKVSKAFRDGAADKGEKITEAAIKLLVPLDPNYIKAKRAYNEAKAMTKLAHSAVEAFRHRKDMLVQMGASERQEREGDLVMRSRSHAPTPTEAMRVHAPFTTS